MADSIKTSGGVTIGLGQSATIGTTATVNAGTPTTARADILFLTDTTGSMGGTITTVQTNFNEIVGALGGDIAYGAAEFKDVSNSSYDGFNYKLNQDITASKSAVQTAIGTWRAEGGGDYAEQGLYALGQAATTTSWRDGAKRIVIMSGDAPSHDDANLGVPAPTSVASTAATLKASNVRVEAIDVGSGGLNDYGQFSGAASIFAQGVEGGYSSSLSSGDLVSTIQSLLGAAFDTYSQVALTVEGGGDGLKISVSDLIAGDFDRSTDRDFPFIVSVLGQVAGTYDLTLKLFGDGALLATAMETVTVTPIPAGILLLGSAMGGLALLRTRRPQGVTPA